MLGAGTAASRLDAQRRVAEKLLIILPTNQLNKDSLNAISPLSVLSVQDPTISDFSPLIMNHKLFNS